MDITLYWPGLPGGQHSLAVPWQSGRRADSLALLTCRPTADGIRFYVASSREEAIEVMVERAKQSGVEVTPAMLENPALFWTGSETGIEQPVLRCSSQLVEKLGFKPVLAYRAPTEPHS